MTEIDKIMNHVVIAIYGDAKPDYLIERAKAQIADSVLYGQEIGYISKDPTETTIHELGRRMVAREYVVLQAFEMIIGPVDEFDDFVYWGEP